MREAPDGIRLLAIFGVEADEIVHLSPEEQLDLLRVAKDPEHEDREDAIQTLIVSNSRLILSFAWKYAKRGVPVDDLFQEGAIGLMRAITGFDFQAGTRFSTYASWWIRQRMSRAVADQGRIIRIPVHRHGQLNRVMKARHRLAQELGRNPSTTELAEYTGEIEERTLRRVLSIATEPQSLDAPRYQQSETTLGETLPVPTAAPVDTDMIADQLNGKVAEALGCLTPREERIIRMRHGFGPYRAHTLEEIGDAFGVTRERIRQIEKEAMHKLRHPVRKRKLESFLDR